MESTGVTQASVDSSMAAHSSRVRPRNAASSLARMIGQPLAAPVFKADGEVVAGLGISAPAARLKSSDVRKQAPLLIEAAAEISRNLGFEAAA